MKQNNYSVFLVLCASIILLFSSCVSSSKKVSRQFVADDGGKTYSNVNLSLERIAQIRYAFIGRSFILKEDWYGYNIIETEPLGKSNAPMPITTFPEWFINEKAPKKQLASKGSFGKISGMRTYRNGVTFICNMEAGGKIYLTITTSRNNFNDARIPVAWVEQNLTHHTVEFIDDLSTISNTKRTMSKPTKLPTLTPVQTGGTVISSGVSPSVAQLKAIAEPAQVKNSEILNLTLDYTVDTAGHDSVPVIETRTLILDGTVLPNYPKTDNLSRSSGHYTTSFKQIIPPRAKTGNYIFKGEVCVEDGCISKISRFQVVK